jgi:hypothetical protein
VNNPASNSNNANANGSANNNSAPSGGGSNAVDPNNPSTENQRRMASD